MLRAFSPREGAHEEPRARWTLTEMTFQLASPSAGTSSVLGMGRLRCRGYGGKGGEDWPLCPCPRVTEGQEGKEGCESGVYLGIMEKHRK